MDELLLHIEALIFAAETPIKIEELQAALEGTFHLKLERKYLLQQIEHISQKYKSNDFSFEIVSLAGGFQFLTKPAYHTSIETLLKHKSQRKLSQATLETLAVIAYRQPITKSEAERIRGVSCDYTIQKLLEKELIEIKGRSTEAGRPLLYATTAKFMQLFGINSLKELPKLKEFQPSDNEIGKHTDQENFDNENLFSMNNWLFNVLIKKIDVQSNYSLTFF